GVISKSPTTGIETPKREKNGRQVLRSDEYTKMLSLAGANPRDYAILQVFLQTGIRVSELANLTKDDIDFIKPSITVRGKGMKEREIFLEKKGVHALKSYLAVRGESFSRKVFLNYPYSDTYMNMLWNTMSCRYFKHSCSWSLAPAKPPFCRGKFWQCTQVSL